MTSWRHLLLIGWIAAMIIMVGGDYYMSHRFPPLSDLFIQAVIAAAVAYPLGWFIVQRAGIQRRDG